MSLKDVFIYAGDELIDEAQSYEREYEVARQLAKKVAKARGWTFDQALATIWQGPKPKLKKKPAPPPNLADFNTVTQTYAKNAINKEFELEKVELSNTPGMEAIQKAIAIAERRAAQEIEKSLRDDMVSGFGIPDVPGVEFSLPTGFVPTTDLVSIVPGEGDNKRAESNKAMLAALEQAYREIRYVSPGENFRLTGIQTPPSKNKLAPPAAPLSKHGRVILPEDGD